MWKPGNPEENHIKKIEEDWILMKQDFFPKCSDFCVIALPGPPYCCEISSMKAGTTWPSSPDLQS